MIVTDKEAIQACRKFHDQYGVLVEPACGAGLSLALVNPHRLRDCLPSVDAMANIVFVVCGGSVVTSNTLSAMEAEHV